MRERTTTALGLDISERGISVALVATGAQGPRTLAAAHAALPAGDPGLHQAVSGKVLSGLLAQLGRRARGGRMRAALAVSVDPLVMQLLDLPPEMPTNLGEFVAGELRQCVPLSGETLVSDFCGVGAGVPRRLLAVAARADRIQELVKACTASGIVVEAVEPSLPAYARAFLERHVRAAHDDGATIALLGPGTLTVGVWRRGTLDFVRTRRRPADADTPTLLCKWLAEEWRAVIRYYETREGGGPLPDCRVVLQDGSHRADTLAPVLAAEAGTRSITVVDACEPGGDSASPAVSMTAVGAALGLLGGSPSPLRVNLVPKTVTEARSRFRHVLLTANACIMAFLGVFLASQFLPRATGAMDRRIEQTRREGKLHTTRALLAEEKYLDQEISRLQQEVQPLRQALQGRSQTPWPVILHAIRQAAPADVSVTQWQCTEGRTLQVQGLASSCPAAETLVRNLEAEGLFHTVRLSSVQRRQDDDGGLEYRIDCLLKAEGGKSP